MKIENIHIDGFGVWSDRSWGALDPGLNIFHGPNETGKSTMMAFVRSILFGFDRRGSVKRYEPLNGGSHGGWLDLAIDDRRLRVERKPGRHVRGTVAVNEGDLTGTDEMLDNLLGGTTRTLYHNVFAFGLEELEQFHTLQESEVATHISGAGLGIGASRWAAVQKDLEERQNALFLPRGQNSTINVAFKELDSVRDDLDRTEQQPQDYWAAHESRTRLVSELAVLGDNIAELHKRIEHYEKRREARPMMERRRRLEGRLKELPAVDSFPEGGLERLQLLNQQLQGLNSEWSRKRSDVEAHRLEKMALNSLADPQEITLRTQIIQALQNLVPRVDASRRVYAACLERREATAQEKATLDVTLENLRPPSQPAFLVFLGLLWAASAGLFWAGQPYAAAGILLVSMSPLWWYRRRLKSTETIQKKIFECDARLATCQKELRTTEDEARQIEAEIRKLTGKVEIAPGDIDARVEDLGRLLKIGDEIRKLDELIAQSEAEIRMIERRVEETRSSIASLLQEGGAFAESEFLERADVFKQRQQILHEIDKIPTEPQASGLLFDMRAEEDAAYEAAAAELAEAEQRLIAARHEAGRVDERISMMERSEDRARALLKKEKVLAHLDVAAEQWAVLTLCRAMLDETRRIYETERQPEVLRQASQFFSVMTDGRYARVFTPLDGTEIQVERADGTRLAPQMLSRGTAEQLYLCMRLALVREYANHVEPLPVVFDDIFVNFDPERTRSSFQGIRDLCSTHQVLLFTCHPHLVEIAQEIIPTAKVFPLQ
jgi:uncharacterized protein YhaN